MTSLFYGYGNDSLKTNTSMLLVLQPSWDLLFNGAVPSLSLPDASSSFLCQTWHDVAVRSVLRSCDSVIPRSHVQTQWERREKQSLLAAASMSVGLITAWNYMPTNERSKYSYYHKICWFPLYLALKSVWCPYLSEIIFRNPNILVVFSPKKRKEA